MSSTLNMLSLKSQRDPQVEMSGGSSWLTGFQIKKVVITGTSKVDEVRITYRAQVEQKEGLDRKPE